MQIELRIADLPEVKEAIAAGIREGLAGAATFKAGWLNKHGVAEAYGISDSALRKKPHFLPREYSEDEGAPDSEHRYKADEVMELIYMTDEHRTRTYKARLIGERLGL